MPLISTNVASGSIEVIAADNASDIRLLLPIDPDGNFLGWYHFRVSGAKNQLCRFSFMNAGAILNSRLNNRDGYEHTWENTGPVVSYDGENWFRLAGHYENGAFSFEHQPDHDLCYYAIWPPYGAEREQRFLAQTQMSDLVRHEVIGHSVEGRPLDMLTIGTPGPDKKICWVVARQHPSETQGGFFVEGVVERLLDRADATAQALLSSAVFYVVANANPDGSANGFTRTNAQGANLNREWDNPSLEKSPEVFYIRQKMEETGLDFFIDCHADKELRCNFIWPSENVPTWRAERWGIFEAFEAAWAVASPDYETGHPYPGGCPDTADLGMGWNWVGNRFPNSLSVLLEQPFKDVTSAPIPETGWSPQRASEFGKSFLEALRTVVDRLG